MGGERLVRLAPGIFARRYDSGKRSILVDFTFRGLRCRETMPGLDPDKKNHVAYAERTLASIRRDINQGTFNYLEYFPQSKRARLFGFVVSKRTVREIAESWLAEAERSLPHSTYRSYAGPCKRFVLPAIGDLRIRDVTVEHIRRMFREADISLKTARNYSIPLRAIFDRALDDDDIDRSPMDRIRIKTLIPKDKHRSTYVVDPLDQGEIDRFLEACARYRPDWLNYWTVAFYTGLRTSEQYGLEWSDINLSQATMHIQRAVVEGRAKEPKTRASNRLVQIPEEALVALRRQREKTELAGDLIFRNPTTGLALTRYEVSERAFQYCLKRAKVRTRNQYQTRHTCASNMLSQGTNPLFVAKQLGHRDVQMVFRVYGKWVSLESDTQPTFGSRKRNV